MSEVTSFVNFRKEQDKKKLVLDHYAFNTMLIKYLYETNFQIFENN